MLQFTTVDVVPGLSNEWAYRAQQSSEQQYTFIRGVVSDTTIARMKAHTGTSQKREANVGYTVGKGSSRQQQP